MPRSAQLTRGKILDSAYRLFRSKGYSRVSIDEIAAATPITKRSLYYHFKSKDELLACMLQTQADLALSAFKTFGDRLSGSPAAIIDAFFEDLANWSTQPRWAGSGFTRLVVELADLPGHPARLIARRHKALLESHLADVLKRAGITRARQRAEEIWVLCEGAMVMMLIHGDRRYATTAAEAAKVLLLSSASRVTRRGSRNGNDQRPVSSQTSGFERR
jgi:AcrR family transcriptional regulator